MEKMQDTTGLARFTADLMRSACGLPLSEDADVDVDAVPEGLGTLKALGIAAEIALGHDARTVRELRAVKEALAETQDRLHRPGRLFAA